MKDYGSETPKFKVVFLKPQFVYNLVLYILKNLKITEILCDSSLINLQHGGISKFTKV